MSSSSRTAFPTGRPRLKRKPVKGSWLRTETLIIFKGRVQWSKATSYSLVATKSANLRVWWVGGVLPPMVFVGNVICGVGKIITFNEGRDWRVSDAVPLQKKYWTVVNPIYNHLWRYLEDPQEWCGPEYLDRFKFKVFNHIPQT